MKPRERQKVWAEIEDFMNSFPNKVNVIYHYAELIGFPSGGDGSRSSNTVSDRTGTIATNLASYKFDDPSVEVAQKLDKWLYRLQAEIRHLEHEIQRCQPERPLADLDKCEKCNKPRSLKNDMILGLCRKCYDQKKYQERRGK